LEIVTAAMNKGARLKLHINTLPPRFRDGLLQRGNFSRARTIGEVFDHPLRSGL
jgi:hypothetical protein